MQRRSFISGILGLFAGEDWDGEVKPLCEIKYDVDDMTAKLQAALQPAFDKLTADLHKIADAKIKEV